MKKYYYTKKNKKKAQKKMRLVGLCLTLGGLGVSMYVFLPAISWQIFYAPKFYLQHIIAPIPLTGMLDPQPLQNATIPQAIASPIDDNNARNWFPNFNPAAKTNQPAVTQYLLTIPKLKISNALVTTVDNDLSLHMVNFAGTSIPPENGTSVVFGHSTLPQLYDPQNYKTILTYAYQLTPGDDIIATVDGIAYDYKIFSMTVVNPNDTSVFDQNDSNSYLTLVTCTPPGTTAQRLVVKAKLQRI